MLSSSRKLEKLRLTVYIVPIGRFEGLTLIRKQLMESLVAIEAKNGDTGRTTKDHELASAMVAIRILMQSIENPRLLEIWP